MSSQNIRYPNLYSNLRIGAVELKNRIVQSALSSGSSREGRVTDRMVNIYRARARGGAAMIVTESLAGHSRQQVGRRIRAMEEASFPGLQRWVDAVESNGCRLLGQLMDPGRGRHHAGRSFAAVGPSALPDDLSWSVPRVLSVDDIRRMIDELAQTAHRLERAGFSGVELSCGHGHLFHQFLSPQANQREDAYGGSREHRTRFVRELCDAIRARCGKRFILGIKLAGDDGVPGGIGPDEASEIARLIAPHAPDYFAMAQGAHHRSLEMHVPDRTYPRTPYRGITRTMRRGGLGIPILAVGRITAPDEAEDLIASGDCDGVMMARALLADAEWPVKAQEGREADIRLCINCNTCWEQTVGGNTLVCDVNPRVGLADEFDWKPPPATRKRRVVVVGAGIAGLEAAWVLAARGHDVTVFGASEHPGGKTRLNALIPGCDQIARSYEHRLQKAREFGVALKLGERVTAGTIIAQKPDRVVLATGAVMQEPADWHLDRPVADVRAFARSLLAQPPGRQSGTAVLYDCDHSPGTYDVADWLADRFEHLVIVTPRELLAQEIATVIRQRVYRRLSQKRATILTLGEVVAYRDEDVTVRNVYNGDERIISEVAALTYSTWRKPCDELLAPLTRAGLEVVTVGDCFTPRPLLQVLAESQQAALQI